MAVATIDIGNTSLKWGLFESGILTNTGNMVPDLSAFPFVSVEVTDCIYCTSGGAVGLDFAKLFPNAKVVELKKGMAGPVPSAYKSPETLGADRVAGYTGARVIFPSDAVLIVDAGTCITYDYVERTGLHRGGMISPGLHMRLRAMHEFTSDLPMVSVPFERKALAEHTTEAIGQGALVGALMEIEGYIDWIRGQFGEIKVLLTGGDADVFAKSLKTEIFVERNLVLLGLYKILKYYAEKHY